MTMTTVKATCCRLESRFRAASVPHIWTHGTHELSHLCAASAFWKQHILQQPIDPVGETAYRLPSSRHPVTSHNGLPRKKRGRPDGLESTKSCQGTCRRPCWSPKSRPPGAQMETDAGRGRSAFRHQWYVYHHLFSLAQATESPDLLPPTLL